jgi:hypothetical protein
MDTITEFTIAAAAVAFLLGMAFQITMPRQRPWTCHRSTAREAAVFRVRRPVRPHVGAAVAAARADHAGTERPDGCLVRQMISVYLGLVVQWIEPQ